jgi:hypothetical protein
MGLGVCTNSRSMVGRMPSVPYPFGRSGRAEIESLCSHPHLTAWPAARRLAFRAWAAPNFSVKCDGRGPIPAPSLPTGVLCCLDSRGCSRSERAEGYRFSWHEGKATVTCPEKLRR